MRPLRLELEGWARFRERQVISFEDLTLFAIAGPTGAGKTLLLDAISFALFGVTPRLSQKLETLISNEADRLMVELQFEVSAGIHRVVRSIERKASGNTSKSIRIERLEDGRWKLVPETDRLKEADQRLEQLVGFDFRSFTRSILLPQGQFDEFLHGDAKLRRSLLKELLDLGRVERMREEAGKRERADATMLAGIEARLGTVELDQAAVRLKQLRQELIQLEQAVAAGTAELELARKSLAEAEELSALNDELARLAPRLSELRSAREQAPALRRELELGRLAGELEPLLALHGQLAARFTAAAAELAELEAGLPAAVSALDGAKRTAAEAAAKLAGREPEIKAGIARLHGLLPLAERLNRSGGAPAGIQAAAEEWDEERFEELLRLKDRLASLQAADRRVARLDARLEQLAGEAEQLEAELAEQKDILAGLLEQGKAAAARMNAAEQRVRELERSGADAVVALRAGLRAGEPCPVCGQVVHELPGEVGHELAEARKELEAGREERQRLLDEYNRVRAVVAGQAARLQANAEAVGGARADRTEAAAELARLGGDFEAAGLSGSPDSMAPQLRLRLDALLASAARRIAEAGGGADPAAALAALDAELTRLTREERRAAEAVTAARYDLNMLKGRLELLGKEQDGRRAELDARRSELDSRLAAAGFADDAAARAAIRPRGRLNELADLLERNSRELASLEQRESELRDRLAGRNFDGAQLRQLQARLRELEATQAAALERRGALQTGIAQEEGLVAEWKELTARRRELEDSRDLWKLLARDLQDHNFTDFLLAGVQQLLARRASRIIRQVTDGRFDLHLSGTREFEVSDAWAGGQRRTARSLSGGETFIVSLALALALSDTAAGGRRLGALFLDEGFGTLDAATLDSVAGVLESLSMDGRMVGIITHVSELSERLPARLMVRKEADGSSVYWED